jgi:uncharacterized protein involved in exopolysaccharide biosynthesis/Mrp family chromosome partitioning ATPase
VNLGQQQRVTPRDVARVLIRRWKALALVFGAIAALTAAAIVFYPRSYASEAKLIIRVGRESVSLDPTATTGQTIMLQKTQDAEVNSAVEILNSAVLHRRVAEAIGVERILADAPDGASSPSGGRAKVATARPSWLDGWLRKLRLSEPGTELDAAVRRIEKGIRVSAPKNSTVISVRYAAVTPELARDVVAAVTDIFLEEHVRLNRTKGSFRFFTEQEAALSAELDAALAELRDYKNKFKVASAPRQQSILQEQIKNVELELLQTTRSLSYSEARIADLSREMAELKPEIVTNRVAGVANEAKDAMRERLYELELKEGRLRAKYTAEHPLVLAVQQERESAERILAKLPDDRTHTTEALNPNQRKLELELIEERSTRTALVAKKKAAAEQLGQLTAKLRLLNEQEVTLAQLERDVALLEDKYQMHAAKLEEARVNEALQQEQITNVNVVQPATFVRKPVWPNKRLFLMLGVILATGGGLGAVALAEVCDQTLRTAGQVEAQLGLPVLLSLRRPGRRKRQRRLFARGTTRGAGGFPKKVKAGAHGPKAGCYGPLISQLVRAGQGSGKSSKFIGVVGCHGEKCRSRVASELALRATAGGSRDVLLIDADARHRRVARRFHLNGSPGFREVMAGVAEAEKCIHRQREGNLAVMSYGRPHGHGAEASVAYGSRDRLDVLKKDFRLIVVDLPSADEIDARSTATEWVDEVVLVVEAEKTRIQSAQSVVRQLERADVRVLGVVLANRRDYVPGWLYRRL